MRISDWSSDVCSSDLGSVLTENAMHSQILDGTRGAGMQRQTKCGGRRKGVVSGGVLATLVLATTCAAMAQGRPAGGTRPEERRVGKRVLVRVDLGGRRTLKKKKQSKIHKQVDP